MTDFARLAAEIVERFERDDFDATWRDHAGAIARGKDAAGLRAWWPNLDAMVGRDRRVTDAVQLDTSPPSARAVLSGDAGEAAITFLFDGNGKVTDLGVADWPLVLGVGNIQIDCPGGSVPKVASLYADLLGMPAPPEHPNWMVLMKDRRTRPALPFAGQAPSWVPARWGDDERPQQMHLELFVRDMDEATAIAERHGAERVDDNVWTDHAGHAIRLEPGDSGDGPAAIARIVHDCFSPRSLARFYEELLGMTTRVEDSAERVVISYDDGRLPMLAFRHVASRTLPRWPDPAYPQQMHLDLKLEDYYGAQRLAERLGAIKLPPLAHPTVYADPAGHPFCLCFPGQ